MAETADRQGNIKNAPCRVIEELRDADWIKIFIHERGGFYAYGYQMRVGALILAKTANVSGAVYQSAGSAQEAAAAEIGRACASNKEAKKRFACFRKINADGAGLFDGV